MDTIVFDKTGTLTKGVFKVTSIQTVQGEKEDELVETAALAEGYSNHPIANSIREAYGRELDLSRVDQTTEEIAGRWYRSACGWKKSTGRKTKNS